MNTIVRYNPAISTLNQGDHIIYESIKEHLEAIFTGSFEVDVSTHLPISYTYAKLLSKADMKFVCGTNLLMGKLNGIFRQWDIHLWNAKWLGPAILVGTGWWQYNNEPNAYTKRVYRKILSETYLHSVRDDYTATQLDKCGVRNVVVTGCPTMWNLTPEHCEGIPKKKATRVVTTLTDYNQDFEKDKQMVTILCKEYEKVYLWFQGAGDYEYYRALSLPPKVQVVSPSLAQYDALLAGEDIDYVGTRLHGGIRALQHKKRTVIIAVDNRAVEKQKSFAIPVLQRKDIGDLAEYLNCSLPISIRLPMSEIVAWKQQFKEFNDED